MQEVDPKVSTASNFLHRTFFSCNFLAVRVSPIVTSTIIPYGTFAVMIPIAKMKFKMAGYPTTKPKQNRRIPTETANIVNLIMNLLISNFKGAS